MEPCVSNFESIPSAAPAGRHSRQASIAWGSRIVTVGGNAPVRIQSMTNTDTVDAIGTAIQIKELALAGSEMVRITVNTPEAAQQVPYICAMPPSDWILPAQSACRVHPRQQQL